MDQQLIQLCYPLGKGLWDLYLACFSSCWGWGSGEENRMCLTPLYDPTLNKYVL